MELLGVVLAYLIGSVSFGVMVGWWHRTEIRLRDLPGASGVFRQVGSGWGLLVGLLDILKGLSVAWLGWSLGLGDWALGAMGAAVVVGHCYPVYFGFRGGGGILTAVGFVMMMVPNLLAMGAAIGLAVAAFYYPLYWHRHRKSIYPLPLAAAIAGGVMLVLLVDRPQDWGAVLPPILALGVRGLSFSRGTR
jgi:glycerol-3-phosphate acyltransferase PlsY